MKNEKVAEGRIIGLAGPCYGKKSHNFIRCMRTYLAKQNITLICVCLEQDANIFSLQIDIFSSKQWVQQYGTSKVFFQIMEKRNNRKDGKNFAFKVVENTDKDG